MSAQPIKLIRLLTEVGDNISGDIFWPYIMQQKVRGLRHTPSSWLLAEYALVYALPLRELL